MKRVLVANRGEIALRIIRACHEEGLEAVAVYSAADRASPHVRAADAAVEIGPAPAAKSYLVVDRLVEAAKQSGADAVHPGYGFLAERAHFADAVVANDLIFIGPPVAAIRTMGDKVEARRQMRDANVPVVPGTVDPVDSPDAAAAAANELGYPVLLKATAGGGGKGMRRAETARDVRRQFESASSEARSAFGDGSVYLERRLERPRHVEIQILADQFGRTLHLGERECSVQRRHQKLIEESPSPVVDLDLREAMGATAVRAAQSVGYVGAGTVEFLLEPDGSFYFLEMNTRIQVEHPVTELVYGVDLVRAQLRIAAGEPLDATGHPLQPRGHAIECRITSEDPYAGFVPSVGTIRYLGVPAGPGIRWDGGVETGNAVTLFYDSLLGKVITWGETRELAIRRMRRALEELTIVGVTTSQPFHRLVMSDSVFCSGTYDIEYLDRVAADLLAEQPEDREIEMLAIAAALAEDGRRNVPAVPTGPARTEDGASRWLHYARRAGLR